MARCVVALEAQEGDAQACSEFHELVTDRSRVVAQVVLVAQSC